MQVLRLLVRPRIQPLPMQQPMTAHPATPGQEREACHPFDGQRRTRGPAATGNRAGVETLGPGPARHNALPNLHYPAANTTNSQPPGPVFSNHQRNGARSDRQPRHHTPAAQRQHH